MILCEKEITYLRIGDFSEHKDMCYMALNSVLEFLVEAFRREAQIANLLVKTTKLMGNVLSILKETLDSYNSQTLKL